MFGFVVWVFFNFKFSVLLQVVPSLPPGSINGRGRGLGEGGGFPEGIGASRAGGGSGGC